MKKQSDVIMRIFIKCLAVLVQPATLILSNPGAQLVSQGIIYALADKIADRDIPFPDINTVLSNRKENIRNDVALILDLFEIKNEMSGCSSFDIEKISSCITDQWIDNHRCQYSDDDAHEIKTAIREYLNEVQKWNLDNKSYLQGVLREYNNSIQQLKDVVDKHEDGLKRMQKQLNQSFNEVNEGKGCAVVKTANEQYVQSFTDPLFLHKHIENSKVNLANIFVLQKYSFLEKDESTQLLKEQQKDLADCLSSFLNQNKKRFMIIDGDAGSGKTSLMAWMNYHHSLHDSVAVKLFGDRPIITIRLRDIDKKDLSDSHDLAKAIIGYMGIKSLAELEALYPDAIMILDGFDELCMIEEFSRNHNYMLIDLWRKISDGFHFIVTTRPKFIDIGFNAPSIFIHLEHFDCELRSMWLDKYIRASGDSENIDEDVVHYILDDEEIRTCICDTPMTLYMLMAKKGVTEYLNNNWALYHHIFYEELSETEYNEMFPNDIRDYSHDAIRIREILYQISEEIAYSMYKRGNSVFYLSQDELRGIIQDLSKCIPLLNNANIRTIAENCFGICCYWKANQNRGVVEFLHNDVRDFFLAEKIYRELNALIENVKAKDLTKTKLAAIIASRLCHLIPYGVLETRVTEFIFFRASYNRETAREDFASFEMKEDLIGTILAMMNQHEIINSRVLEEHSFIDIVQRIINIITSTAQIYRYSLEPYLGENKVIRWRLTAGDNNYSNAWKNLFKAVFCQVPVTITFNSSISMASYGDFSRINLQYCDLRHIGFDHSKIAEANLCDTVLYGTDFSSAVLVNTGFKNAVLHYSSLENADITGCDFTNADLRGTTLPDGYMSMVQEDQVAHLKSMGITGLVV